MEMYWDAVGDIFRLGGDNCSCCSVGVCILFHLQVSLMHQFYIKIFSMSNLLPEFSFHQPLENFHNSYHLWCKTKNPPPPLRMSAGIHCSSPCNPKKGWAVINNGWMAKPRNQGTRGSGCLLFEPHPPGSRSSAEPPHFQTLVTEELLHPTDWCIAEELRRLLTGLHSLSDSRAEIESCDIRYFMVLSFLSCT